MDTRTGEIHKLRDGETIEDLAERMHGKPKDFVPVARKADGVCRKCKGTGRLRRGMLSRRYKPCRCVL